MKTTIRNNRSKLLATLHYIASQAGAPTELVRALVDAWRKPGALAISSDDPSRVSFARNPADKYDDKRRTVVSLAKYLMRETSKDVAHRERWIDIIGTTYRDRIIDVADFEQLTGNDIVDAYRAEVGNHSCVTDEDAHKTEIYARNPLRVSMLTYRKTRARALVWHTDCGATLVDRIYAPSLSDCATVRSYARSLGWIVRIDDGQRNCGWTGGGSYTVSGLTMAETLVVPWMDTLDIGTYNGDTLTISCSGDGDCLRCCELGPYAVPRQSCYCCDRPLDDDDHHRNDCGDHYCGDCYYEHYAQCDCCGVETPHDDTRSTPDYETFCESCYCDAFADCHCCCDVVHHDDVTIARIQAPAYRGGRIYEETVCHSCADEHAPVCVKCDQRYVIATMVSTFDGMVCEDCHVDA